MFSEKELNLEEHQLREQIRRLSPLEKSIYDALEIPRLKMASRYVQLNWLFPLGVHHFYLRRWGRGLLDLFLTFNVFLSLSTYSPWGDSNGLVAGMLFAALLLIALSGVVIFAVLSLLSHLLLRKWHESALKRET
jgi:hypothetical protein